jgi:hypothetical protein
MVENIISAPTAEKNGNIDATKAGKRKKKPKSAPAAKEQKPQRRRGRSLSFHADAVLDQQTSIVRKPKQA